MPSGVAVSRLSHGARLSVRLARAIPASAAPSISGPRPAGEIRVSEAICRGRMSASASATPPPSECASTWTGPASSLSKARVTALARAGKSAIRWRGDRPWLGRSMRISGRSAGELPLERHPAEGIGGEAVDHEERACRCPCGSRRRDRPLPPPRPATRAPARARARAAVRAAGRGPRSDRPDARGGPPRHRRAGCGRAARSRRAKPAPARRHAPAAAPSAWRACRPARRLPPREPAPRRQRVSAPRGAETSARRGGPPGDRRGSTASPSA